MIWPLPKRNTPRWLRRKVSRLSENATITARFEAAILARNDRKKDNWFGSQKEHWLGWLAEYNGPGYYGRKAWDVTAEQVYNRVVNPSMLLWLAEASGVDRALVEHASKAALAAPSKMPAQSAAIRKTIPWTNIETAILKGNAASVGSASRS